MNKSELSNVKEIVRRYLKGNGYDGLFDDLHCCGCDIDELGGCNELDKFVLCIPGYKSPCSCENNDHRYHIVKQKAALEPKEFNKQLANKIAFRRKELGMSLEYLAEKVTSSKGYIWEIEQGNTKVSAWILFKIAKALYLSMNELLSNEPLKEMPTILWRELERK